MLVCSALLPLNSLLAMLSYAAGLLCSRGVGTASQGRVGCRLLVLKATDWSPAKALVSC
jgi:hypothetical protein